MALTASCEGFARKAAGRSTEIKHVCVFINTSTMLHPPPSVWHFVEPVQPRAPPQR